VNSGDRYVQVLCSSLWWERRSEIVEARGAVCEACGIDGEALELHHLTYENLGDENDSELVLLCGECHCRAHGWWR
jgi:5-methylcytosine-specific restriction endonuclease McrA